MVVEPRISANRNDDSISAPRGIDQAARSRRRSSPGCSAMAHDPATASGRRPGRRMARRTSCSAVFPGDASGVPEFARRQDPCRRGSPATWPRSGSDRDRFRRRDDLCPRPRTPSGPTHERRPSVPPGGEPLVVTRSAPGSRVLPRPCPGLLPSASVRRARGPGLQSLRRPHRSPRGPCRRPPAPGPRPPAA
jgi:hypothetical protein